MKSLRSIFVWGTLMGLVGFFGTMPSALAQIEGRTTAGEVVNRESLMDFVLHARDYIEGITDNEVGTALRNELLQEGGPWKHENTYLIILELTGAVRLHAGDVTLGGTDLTIVEDDEGELVFPKMLAAAQGMDDGDFVEYHWDDPSDPNDTNPKVCYAIMYTSQLEDNPRLMVGGYYQDLSDVVTDISGFPAPLQSQPPTSWTGRRSRLSYMVLLNGTLKPLKISELI